MTDEPVFIIEPSPPRVAFRGPQRGSPRTSIGTLQVSEMQPPSSVPSPLASATLKKAETSDSSQQISSQINSPQYDVKPRAVSLDAYSDVAGANLPKIADIAVEWGILYDDELFEAPVRSRTQSLDFVRAGESPEQNTRRSYCGGGKQPHRSCNPISLITLPPVDERHSLSTADVKPPPLLDKSNSFRGRNSMTVLARHRHTEIEVRPSRRRHTSSDTGPTECAESDLESERSEKHDQLRLSSPTFERQAVGGSASSSMDQPPDAAALDDVSVSVAISAASSIDESDDLRSSMARTSIEERPSICTVATPVEVVEKRDVPVLKHVARAESALTNAHVLQFHRHLLSEFEINEILDYRSVYFFGHGACKVALDSNEPLENHGFDDKDGNFIARVGCHIAYRYEVADELGKGSFGIVRKCMDHKEMRYVAIKIVKNRKRFHKQVVNEIKILDMMREHKDFATSNCILLQDKFQFRKHMCLSFPLSGRSIFDFMKAHKFKPNSKEFVLTVARQLLGCLSFLSDLEIIHCDLKPENILLVNETEFSIKLIDFGSSCLASEKIFSYIQSRYYRAPEVILGLGYGTAIDMWSLGCILPELRYGDPLITGNSEADQLCASAEIIGPPPLEMLLRTKKTEKLGIREGVLQYTVKKNGKLRRAGSRSLSKLVFKRTDEKFSSFLSLCLKWDPNERFSPREALAHPWITGLDAY